jgi:DNA polymerase I-like protein with 3'-5' exonuclease and polymerase domains
MGQMRHNKLSIGRDGRNRCMLSAFRAKTGRNQPSNSKFIFGSACWLRSLIKAEPDHAFVYVDWAQQEFGIAASLSGDPAMMRDYISGDPYLSLAKHARAVPEDATKQSHEEIREQYKTCALGTLYNMGAWTLAERTGLYLPYAQDLLRQHRALYPHFWNWSDDVLNYAMLQNHLYTVFGWHLWVGEEPNPNSLRNFLMQANGAEILRLACCLALDRGIKVVAPVHDALLIEAPVVNLVGTVIAAQRAMRDASRIVLGNLELRTDVKIFRAPNRYVDKRGVQMWRKVWKLIRES